MPVDSDVYKPQYPINFTPDGDLTRDAIYKFMQETERIYSLIFSIASGQLSPADLAALEDRFLNDGYLDMSLIRDKSVTGRMIADDAITSGHIKDGEVKTDDLADGAVTGDKIADETITGDKIVDGTITVDKIAGGGLVADYAEKLVPGADITTKLDKLGPTHFNGADDIELGITGVLPAAYGGTGRTDGMVRKAETVNAVEGHTNGAILPEGGQWVYFAYCSATSAGGGETASFRTGKVAGGFDMSSLGGGTVFYIAIRIE